MIEKENNKIPTNPRMQIVNIYIHTKQCSRVSKIHLHGVTTIEEEEEEIVEALKNFKLILYFGSIFYRFLTLGLFVL